MLNNAISPSKPYLYSSVGDNSNQSRPLLWVKTITDAKCLAEIINELQVWSNVSTKVKGADASWYNALVENISEIVSERLNSSESETNKKYLIFAAYDIKNNLQGVEIAHLKQKNAITAMKVDLLICSIYNTDFYPSENFTKMRGAGTCLLTRAIEMLPANTFLYLDPLGKSYKFYTHIGFYVSEDYPGYLLFSTNELPKLTSKIVTQLQPSQLLS